MIELSTGSPVSCLDLSPVSFCLCRCRSGSSGNCLGTISDRRTSNGNFPAADQSGKSSSSAWFPRLVATDSFCELLFSDAPCPQRTLHFDGPPTALLEPRLHAEFGVDAVHAAQSSDGPRMDCEGGRPLHFSVAGLTRLSAHRRHGPLVAFFVGLRIPSQRFHFYRFAFLHRSMEASGSDLVGNSSCRLESFCLLRHVAYAGGAKRLLPIQPAPTAFILRCHFHHGTALHVDRDSDVARG